MNSLPPAPPPTVIREFDVETPLQRLPGGNGETWRAGDIVLKPVRDAAEAMWVCDFTARVPQRGFRVPSPLRSRVGEWVVEGWTASTWLPGEHRSDRWSALFAAADAFHAAARAEALPSFIRDGGWQLAQPLDRWRFADRVAWGEVPAGELASRPEVRMLLEACRPVAVPNQVVHCDLVGNVLFADDHPPAIIDLSLYWRPIGYSAAITFADAATWAGAPPKTIELLERYEDWPQLFVRGVLFRVLVNEIARRYDRGLDRREPFGPIVDRALSASASRTGP